VISPVRLAERAYDALDRRWEDFRTRRTIGTTLVLAYLAALLVIEVNRQGLMPDPLGPALPTNHFAAVDLAFRLLLIYEIISLVFVLSKSISRSVGTQFELLSLILFREAFLQLGSLGEPIVWQDAEPVLLKMLADAGGALFVFVAVGFYYRIQRHRKITEDEKEEQAFIRAKKGVGLLLLAAFGVLGAVTGRRQLMGDPVPFFEVFFLLLIFADILIVLISFRYSTSYRVIFRNTGFAVSTVLIRLALTAPVYFEPLLGVGAAVFAVGVTMAYNFFAPVMTAEVVDERREGEGEAGGTPGAEDAAAEGGAAPGDPDAPSPARTEAEP
jgi:hypothetical protein